MKKLFFVAALAAGLVAGGVFAADPTDQKINADVHHLKKDYQAKVAKELRDITHRIRLLKHKALKADSHVRAEIRKETRKLDAQKADADRKFAELKKSTGEAWKDLQKGVDAAVDNLKKSVDEAADRFKI